MGNGFFAKIEYGLPALRHRNFRLFWFGQCISLVGTWMQNIGQAWLVLELTHSALKLSIVTMVQFLPMTLLSLYAGTFADRYPKRKTLILTQSIFALLAVILASITYFHVVKYWHVLVLALLLGIVNTFDIPVRQAFVVDLTGKEDLKNAIALNSAIFNLGRIAGPAVAGLLIGLIGIAPCFYLNAASYLAVILNLWMIRVSEAPGIKNETDSIKEIYRNIREGLVYVKQREIIKQPLLLLAFISTFVMNYNIIVPVYARQILHQTATGYGLLMTSMGIGSFLGSLAMIVLSRRDLRLRYLVGGAFFMSLFFGLLAFENSFRLSCVILFLIGFCTILFTNQVNIIIQLNSADQMRGRVMSVYTLVFGGVIPIGSFYTGQATEFVGVTGYIIISSVIGILATVYSISQMRKRSS